MIIYKKIFYFELVVFALFALFIFNASCNSAINDDSKVGKGDTLPLSFAWEKPIPTQIIPEGLSSISALECKGCHTDIYEEWSHSTHSLAMKDLQFQAEWKKTGAYFCINCHAPFQNQQEQIILGLLNGDFRTPVFAQNKDFDPKFQAEAITCATCHVRDGFIIGTKRIDKAPHAIKVDTVFLSEQICLSCHNVSAQLDSVMVCTFQTGDEWRSGPEFNPKVNCIHCHMPVIERPWAKGQDIRPGHAHNFPGSGIPKFPDLKVERLDGFSIKTSIVDSVISVSDSLIYIVDLINSNAGHKVPTGDPERFYLIECTLIDTYNDTVYKHSYRIGETWEWYPLAKKIDENNFKQFEEKKYHFSVGNIKKGMYQLQLIVSKHRMSKKTAQFHDLIGKYPISITVFTDKISVEVK